MLPAHTFFTLFYPLLPFITQNFPQPNAKSNPKPKKQLEKSLSEKRDEVNFSQVFLLNRFSIVPNRLSKNEVERQNYIFTSFALFLKKQASLGECTCISNGSFIPAFHISQCIFAGGRFVIMRMSMSLEQLCSFSAVEPNRQVCAFGSSLRTVFLMVSKCFDRLMK